MLEVPRHASRLRIERQGRIQVQAVVGDAALFDRMQQQTGVVGLRHPEESQLQFRIVAAGRPHRSAIALLQRHIVPGLVVRVAWLSDGIDMPEDFSGLRIETDDPLSAGLPPHRPLHDLAVHDQGSAAHASTRLGIAERLLPHQFAGLRVQRDHHGIGRGEVHLVFIQRNASLRRGRPGRELARVLPQLGSRRGIQRLDVVSVAGKEHDAVVHQRRRLIGAGLQSPGPGHAQLLDVRLVDLRQGAEAHVVDGSPPDQPIVGRRGLPAWRRSPALFCRADWERRARAARSRRASSLRPAPPRPPRDCRASPWR